MQIIGTCGFCGTGSSAVSDYLTEFDENQVLDRFEFSIPYLPDGLADLEYHLMKHATRDDSSSIAIPRFRRFMKFHGKSFIKKYGVKEDDFNRIVEDFINEIVQVRFHSVRRSYPLLHPSSFYSYFGWHIMREKVFPRLKKLEIDAAKYWPCQEVEVSVCPDNFLIASKKFVFQLLRLMGADFKRNLVLDQPFSGNDPVSSFHLFDNPKAIVVDRDPRDNYLFTKFVLNKRHVNHMPADSAEHFVSYYEALRHNQPYIRENPNILLLHFEELVYDYDNATKKIRTFVGLGENPRPQSIFVPQMSMANTQLFKRYPEFAEDIKYIEDHLKDYLYDFSPFPEPDLSGKMFMGKSPLNNN